MQTSSLTTAFPHRDAGGLHCGSTFPRVYMLRSDKSWQKFALCRRITSLNARCRQIGRQALISPCALCVCMQCGCSWLVQPRGESRELGHLTVSPMEVFIPSPTPKPRALYRATTQESQKRKEVSSYSFWLKKINFLKSPVPDISEGWS